MEVNQPVVRTVGNISTAIAQSEFGNSVHRSVQVSEPRPGWPGVCILTRNPCFQDLLYLISSFLDWKLDWIGIK